MRFCQLVGTAACATAVALTSVLGEGQDFPDVPTATLTPLEHLTVEDVQVLLRSWHLDRAFAAGFKQNQYDGLLLHTLLDLPTESLTTELKSQFPNVVLPQWLKLRLLLQRVVEAGGITREKYHDADAFNRIQDEEPKTRFRRALDDSEMSDYSGLMIKRDNAVVALGPEGDVMLKRSENSALQISADNVDISAVSSFVVNGTDVLGEIEFLLAEASDMRQSIRTLNQEMYYVMEKVNETCTAVSEDEYPCSDISFNHGDCITDVATLQDAWTDRTYAFEEAPAELLDTFHTYLTVPMSTSPPCATEGGFYGTLAEDAQIAICCANHGTYSDAGNVPYASAGTEGYSDYAYGLVWTEHSGEWSLSDHGGTPCTFYETFLEAGTHLVCCSEAWATGIFVTTPELSCD